MREIKYQVYDRKLQMMFDVVEISRLDHSKGFIKGQQGDSGGEYYVTSGYLSKRISLGPNGTAPIVNRFELRQCTEFLSKNGAEIYEGDIVEYGLVIGVIGFFEGAFRFNFDGREDGDYLADLAMNESTVIGNIYENPELLESEE